jgi:hypothetical protein
MMYGRQWMDICGQMSVDDKGRMEETRWMDGWQWMMEKRGWLLNETTTDMG